MSAVLAAIEEWRPVHGFAYEVSNMGRVRRCGGRVLTPRVHTHGYLRVTLCSGERRDAFIHRLVCSAFHGASPADDSHADHINGDRADNRAENLRWLSPSENRSLRKIARGEGSGCSKLTEVEARAIKTTPFSRGGDAKLAATLGVSREQVRDIRLGKSWRHVHA